MPHPEMAEILDRHLRQVIAGIESSHAIELTAIGVKHDVGRYYRNNPQSHAAEDLGVALIAMVDRFLS